MSPRAAAVVVGSVDHRSGVLLIHRIKGAQSYWVLPGGSIEPGETPEQACLREVWEETGLVVEIVAFLVKLVSRGREENYFLVRPTGGLLALGGTEASRQSASNRYRLQWVPQEQLPAINLQPEGIRAVVSQCGRPPFTENL